MNADARLACDAAPSEPLPAAGVPAPQGIIIQLPQLTRLEELVLAALEGRAGQTWYTLEQAWRLKYACTAGEDGAISLTSIKGEMALQPRGGLPDAWQSNRKVWRRTTIDEWLLVDDAGLDAYLKANNPNRRVPARIKEALSKRVRVKEAL